MKSHDIPTWDAQQRSFDMSKGYILERADVAVWAVHYTVSGLANNAWFRQSWDQLLARFSAEGVYFWIKHNDHRIGGVCLQPNEIGCLYLEPPHTDFDQVLYLLKRLLLRWSDPNQPIATHSISMAQAELYLRHGFRPIRHARYMIRATEPFEVVWPAQYQARPPIPADADALLSFIQKEMANTVDADTPENDRSFINFYFEQNVEDSVEHRASLVLIDRHTDELVGECLVYSLERWPFIGSIAIHHNLRSQGLASTMICHALNTLHAQYPVLRLFSTAGNVSGSLYNHLGFVAGPLFYEMVLPHPESMNQVLTVPKW